MKKNLVYKIIDFGYEELFNILESRCSLQQSLDFDMQNFESKVDSDFKILTSIKNKL